MLRAPDAERWRRWLEDVPLPELVPMRTPARGEPLTDPAAALRDALSRAEASRALPDGGRVAIAVGSRGMHALRPLVGELVRVLRRAGCTPFLVPAMGSHGGATAEGQRRVLGEYGLLDLGVPVEADLAVREVGRLADGTALHASEAALAADALILVNRVKSHTGFHGEIGSGLTKMLVVGLGKDAGARALHARGYDGFADRLVEARPVLLRTYPRALGLATVENARGEICRVEALPASAWAEREPELLREAKARMPRLPFEKLDVLVVARGGKDVSGLGIDPNVTGRHPDGRREAPDPTRIVWLALTPGSEGNANGMGFADVVTRRFAEAVDPQATWINAATSTLLESVRLPAAMPDDATAVRLALRTCGAAPGAARVALVRDTAHLETVWVSERLVEEGRRGGMVAHADAARLRLDGDDADDALSRSAAGDQDPA